MSPFGRLHEEAAGEDKLLILSDAAWRMWGMGLIYCQKNLTDGFIDARAIELWGVKVTNKKRVADELCRPQVKDRAPLWSRVEGGFQVHDYLDWNDSKEEILKGRAAGRERITRYRQRQEEDLARLRRIAEQVGEPASERNALHNAEKDAHDVVRGSGEVLKEQKDREKVRSTPGRSAGVMGGSLPREHLSHAACDPTLSRCVPAAVHDKLANLLAPKHNGDRQTAKDALQAWYPTVWATLPGDFVMPDAFKFWQARFDAAFASKDVVATDATAGRTGAASPDKYAAVTTGLKL